MEKEKTNASNKNKKLRKSINAKRRLFFIQSSCDLKANLKTIQESKGSEISIEIRNMQCNKENPKSIIY
jgi:hypothetical protein